MFICRSGQSEAYEFPVAVSSGIVAGDLCVLDVTNNVVIPATAALLNEDLAGVSIETAGAAAGVVKLIPLRDQLWEWDCTNATAADQLCQRSILTNAATVANTTTEQAVDEVTVVPIVNVGTSKQRGFIGRNIAAVS